jgi:hypothetical protein
MALPWRALRLGARLSAQRQVAKAVQNKLDQNNMQWEIIQPRCSKPARRKLDVHHELRFSSLNAPPRFISQKIEISRAIDLLNKSPAPFILENTWQADTKLVGHGTPLPDHSITKVLSTPQCPKLSTLVFPAVWRGLRAQNLRRFRAFSVSIFAGLFHQLSKTLGKRRPKPPCPCTNKPLKVLAAAISPRPENL